MPARSLRSLRNLFWSSLALALLAPAYASAVSPPGQYPLPPHRHGIDDGEDICHVAPEPAPQSVSISFFASLERLARLVDITYCVGTTGISPPFSCVSRCKEFPNLQLASTWNTGVLMSDSCGYIAVDHSGADSLLSPDDSGNAGAIIVAFRGTYSITNTIIDLSTIPQEYVPYPAPGDGDEDGDVPKDTDHKCTKCTVHMGFLASWRSAREEVLPILKELHDEYPDYPVHLVGHSLGGAVAALAALELKVSLGWEAVVVTTFGEPRVGNDGLSRYIDEVFRLSLRDDDGYDRDLERRRTFRRVTHADDPVPLLPLAEWGYRSHGGEVYIAKSGLPPVPPDLRICRGDVDRQCISGAGEASARLKLWHLFFAHRDYFWRLGLCVPGGDPVDWGRERYNYSAMMED